LTALDWIEVFLGVVGAVFFAFGVSCAVSVRKAGAPAAREWQGGFEK
jgi:hypothetical protein